LNQVGIFTLKKASSLIWGNLTTTVVSGVVIYLLYKLKNKRQQKEFLEKKLSGEETVKLEKQKLALEQEIHQMKQEREASSATPLSEELGLKAKQKMDLFRKIECYVNFLNLAFENKLIRVIWNENAAFRLMSHHLFEENKNITEIREILKRTEELFHSEVIRLLGIDSYKLIKRISRLKDISLIEKRDREDLIKIQKRSDILEKITEPLGRIKDLLHVEIKNQLTVSINEICLLPVLAQDDDSDVKAIKDKLEEVKEALNRSDLSPDLLFDNDVIKQLRKQLMHFTMEMKKLDKLPDLSLNISGSRQITQLLSQIERSINQLRKL
ncbi:MAG: hypothetical protein JXA94_07255, partial [Parachlamydiales bacterium]|nr:hypothetical protein [Parachlamydiales bacterium]